MVRDWGVPDWRDASAYPRPDQTTMREWWWEFTRRRSDYRETWDRAIVREGKEYRQARDVEDFRLRFEMSVVHDPSRRLSDWDLMHFRYPRNYSTSPLDPVLEQAAHPLAKGAVARAVHRAKLAEDAGQELYSFDLSRPLVPQLKHAENHLKAGQAALFGKVVARRPRRDNWREFLRAIDARDAGATYREMRDVFWPGRAKRKDGKEDKTEQSARDTHAAACELRDNFPI